VTGGEAEALASLVAAIASVVLALIAFTYSRKKDSNQEADKKVREVIRAELIQPLERIREVREEVSRLDERGTKGLGATLDRIAVLEAKVDVFWREVGMGVARALHSPDPGRARVDALLEAFYEERITAPQRAELKQALQQMTGHGGEAGAGFPVHPGDKVLAAILLPLVDHVGKGRQ